MKIMFYGKFFMLLVIFFVLLGCVMAPPYKNMVYTGETSPMLAGTTWRMGEYILTFQSDGKVIWTTIVGIPHEYGNNSTWERRGTSVSIVFGDGRGLFEGNIGEVAGIRSIIGGYFYQGPMVGFSFTVTLQPR